MARNTLRIGVLAAWLLSGLGSVQAKDAHMLNDAAPVPIGTGFDMRLPEQETVAFRGGMSLDGAGAPHAPVLYLATGGLGGFLLGIATHGAIVESVKEGKKTQIQREADKVLDPYRESIATFTFRQLAEPALQKDAIKGLGRLIGAQERGEGFVLHAEPLLTLTADRRALVLDNLVTVYRAGIPSEALYRNVFRVVSDPRSDDDLQGYWGRDNALALRTLSQALFAQSLKMAVRLVEAPTPADAAEKTMRFYEGGVKLVERGQMLDLSCGRVTGRTLRGWILSAPTALSHSDTACESAKL